MVPDALVLLRVDMIARLTCGQQCLVHHATHTDEVDRLTVRRDSFHHFDCLELIVLISFLIIQ